MAQAKGSFDSGDAIRELALAWKTLTVYPLSHPACNGATDEALRQVRGLAAPTGHFVLGVSRDALLVGDQRVEGSHSARVAARLHDLGVGVIRIGEGLRDEDLIGFLLALRPVRGPAAEIPLATRLEQDGVRGIEVIPVDFSHVQATEDLTTPPSEEAPESPRSLWDRILGAQLAGGGPRAGASAVLELLNRYLEGGAPAGDGGAGPVGGGGSDGSPAIEVDETGLAVGAELAALGRRLSDAVGDHVVANLGKSAGIGALRQVGELVGALPRGLREQVLDAAIARIADHGNSRLAFAELQTSTAAIDLVSSLRRVRGEGRRLSRATLDWLGGLLEADTLAQSSPVAATAEELKRLAGEPDDLPALRSDEALLELPSGAVRLSASAALRAELAALAPHAQLQMLLATLLELLGRCRNADQARAVTTRLEHLVLTLIRGLKVRPAAALLRHLAATLERSPDGPMADELRRTLERLAGPSTVELLVDLLPGLTHDEASELRELVDLLGDRLTRNLLIGLCEQEDRSRRRQLFDFLRGGSEAILSDARRLLHDSRWYVVRNMVGLLQALGGKRVIPDLRECLQHSDARVRMEALRALAEIDRELPPELVGQLLADEDPRVAERMAQMAGHLAAGNAIEPLLALVTPIDTFGRQRAMRVKALLALGEIGDPTVLARIKRYFSAFSVDSIEERRAAYQSLAGYPAAERAELVEKGRKSRDPEIRAICEQLTGSDHA